MSVNVTILVEAEVILQSGESETRIVDLTISSPQDFIPKLLFEVRREFTDNVRLPPGSPRIYVLSERDKPIRIAPNASVEPLLKWNGIYFESGANLVQHKFRVQIIQSTDNSAPATVSSTSALPAIVHGVPMEVETRETGNFKPQKTTSSDSISNFSQGHALPNPSARTVCPMVNSVRSRPTTSSVQSPPTTRTVQPSTTASTIQPKRKVSFKEEKPGIIKKEEKGVIIKSNGTLIKDLDSMKKVFSGRKIDVTNETAKLIGDATKLDENKIKKIMEYFDLSDKEENKQFTKPEVVKRVLALLQRHNWDGDSVMEEEEEG